MVQSLHETLGRRISQLLLASIFVLGVGCSSEEEAQASTEPSAGLYGEDSESAPIKPEQEVSQPTSTKEPTLPSSEEIGEAPIDDVFAMLTQMLEEVKAVLAGVKDVTTAQAALPALQKIAASAQAISQRKAELIESDSSPTSKFKVGQMAMQMLGKVTDLGQESERLDALPGVKDVLEPVMQEIFRTMGS